MWGGEEDEVRDVNLHLGLALGSESSGTSGGKAKKYPKGYSYTSPSYGADADVDGSVSESDARGGRAMGSSRKKLQLTREQTLLLEEYFRWSPTLDPAQKHELALRLNLQPRQVEVWFQNRRARTKMKQTEEECEVLKRCCQSLREENHRLKMELCDLKTCLGSRATSTYMCSSCRESKRPWGFN